MEPRATLSLEVLGVLLAGGEGELSVIRTTCWVGISAGAVLFLPVGMEILSSTPAGESGGVFSSGLLRAGTSRLHLMAGSVLSSFPKTVRPPLKREPGRLRAAKCALTFSPLGDLEEERVRRGRRAVTANIEYLYIRNYGTDNDRIFEYTIFSRTLYSNLRFFLVILCHFVVIL
jgi:hypothetical protein